jgi:hypothetical protein
MFYITSEILDDVQSKVRMTFFDIVSVVETYT